MSERPIDEQAGTMPEDEEEPDEPHETAPLLGEDEEKEVADRTAGSARVIHEVIRLEGERELKRPWTGLMFSGLAAGVAITASPISEAILQAALPPTPWRHLVVSLGYPIGFLIVIMGSMQLFTETTVTAVLPLATKPTWRKLRRLARLWSIVFAANMAGTLATAALLSSGTILTPEAHAALVGLSEGVASRDFAALLMRGIPAGFLIACVAWILPNARGAEWPVIVTLTYAIAIADLSHVVAGSTEAWFLWLSGGCSLAKAAGGMILPALIGNVVGGTGLFAVLAHGQVREELGAPEALSREVRG